MLTIGVLSTSGLEQTPIPVGLNWIALTHNNTLLLQIKRLDAKYKYVNANKEPKATASQPECVRSKLKALRAEMSQFAMAHQFAEAGNVKKRVRMRQETPVPIVGTSSSCGGVMLVVD